MSRPGVNSRVDLVQVTTRECGELEKYGGNRASLELDVSTATESPQCQAMCDGRGAELCSLRVQIGTSIIAGILGGA